MKLKNTWIVSVGLIVIAVAGILIGNVQISGVAVGGLVGWLAGDRNAKTEEE